MAGRSTVGPRGGYGGTGRGYNDVVSGTNQHLMDQPEVPPMLSRSAPPDMLAAEDPGLLTRPVAASEMSRSAPPHVAPSRPQPDGDAGRRDLRSLFTGSVLKKIIGLPHVMSDVLLAHVSHPDEGDAVKVASDRSDVYVHFVDEISGHHGIGRLYSPGGIFWRVPAAGESVMALQPSDAAGPGVPYVLHGDGGAKYQVPAWLAKGDCGFATADNLHIESGNVVILKGGSQAQSAGGQDDSFTCTIKLDGTTGKVTISGGIGQDIDVNANGGGNVIVNGGQLKVARVTDQITGNAGPYPIANGVISGPGALNFKA